jgi:copper(I)-binding protein
MADSDDMSDMEMGSDSMSEMDGQMKMMGMKQVPSIALPAGEEVKLEPGGYHIMIMGLKDPIEAGDEYQITLEFENAGEIAVQAIARDN